MKKKAVRLLLVRSKHLSRPGKTNEGAVLLARYICTALTYVCGVHINERTNVNKE